MPIRQPGAIGIEDLPLLVKAFVSSFLPGVEAKIHKSATFSATLNASGQLTALEVGEPGFGYASAPTISFNGQAISGQSLVAPSVTVGITASGQVDVDNITINSAGSGYAQIAAAATANPSAGKVAAINISGLAAKKRYDSAPQLVFDVPTSVDLNGIPLGSNVQATATLNLNSDGEITGSTITQSGNGYVVDTRNDSLGV